MVKIGNHSTSADRYGGQSDAIESKIRAGVHETGHNLDMVHKNGLRYEDTIQGQNVVLATPMGCTSDDNWETSCGENCTTDATQTWDHYYGSCEANNITL